MTRIDWNRAGKYFVLWDFLKGFALGMKFSSRPRPR